MYIKVIPIETSGMLQKVHTLCELVIPQLSRIRCIILDVHLHHSSLTNVKMKLWDLRLSSKKGLAHQNMLPSD